MGQGGTWRVGRWGAGELPAVSHAGVGQVARGAAELLEAGPSSERGQDRGFGRSRAACREAEDTCRYASKTERREFPEVGSGPRTEEPGSAGCSGDAWWVGGRLGADAEVGEDQGGCGP